MSATQNIFSGSADLLFSETRCLFLNISTVELKLTLVGDGQFTEMAIHLLSVYRVAGMKPDVSMLAV